MRSTDSHPVNAWVEFSACTTESCGKEGACLQEGCWHQRPHEGWDVRDAKEKQEYCSTHKQIWRQQEAQSNQDDSAGLSGVVGDDCMPNYIMKMLALQSRSSNTASPKSRCGDSRKPIPIRTTVPFSMVWWVRNTC